MSPRKQSVVEKSNEIESGFANFAQFPDDKKQVNAGAFQVYRKPGKFYVLDIVSLNFFFFFWRVMCHFFTFGNVQEILT